MDMYKIIDSRTREILISRLSAESHTKAEERARAMCPGLHIAASLLPDPRAAQHKKKKETRKR